MDARGGGRVKVAASLLSPSREGRPERDCSDHDAHNIHTKTVALTLN